MRQTSPSRRQSSSTWPPCWCASARSSSVVPNPREAGRPVGGPPSSCQVEPQLPAGQLAREPHPARRCRERPVLRRVGRELVEDQRQALRQGRREVRVSELEREPSPLRPGVRRKRRPGERPQADPLPAARGQQVVRRGQGPQPAPEGADECRRGPGARGGLLGDGLDHRQHVLHPVRQLGQQQELPLLGRLPLAQVVARLVLAPPRPQRRPGGTRQRRGVERPLDERHVAQHRHDAQRRRIPLGAARPARQQHEGEVRPGRLVGEPGPQATRVGGRERLLGHHRQPGAVPELAAQRVEVGAGLGGQPRLAENGRRQRRVPAVGARTRTRPSSATCACSRRPRRRAAAPAAPT